MGSNKYFLIGATVVAGLVAAIFFLNRPANTPAAPAATGSFIFDPSLLIRPHSLVKGPDDAKVTMVEFMDPQCEACAAMHPILKKLLKEYDGQVRLVIRYMPFHSHALYAAALLEEARESGKYDQLQDILFERLEDWGGHHDARPELLKDYMKEIGIDKMRSEEDYVVKKHGEKVKLDEADGQKLGVDRTPTFFINGVRQPDIGYTPLKAGIENALRN
jgi:protein-disulfide isomerase